METISANKKRVSTDDNEKEKCSSFESLPREMKYKILQHLFDSLKSDADTELFFKLKLVNREFNYLLSSDYAKRHSIVKSQFYLHVYRSGEDKSKINIYAYINAEHVASSKNINWSDIPKFLEENEARLKGISIRDCILDENAFKAITEFAQKKPFTLALSTTGLHSSTKVDEYIRKRLKDLVTSRKLKIRTHYLNIARCLRNANPSIDVRLEDGTFLRGYERY